MKRKMDLYFCTSEKVVRRRLIDCMYRDESVNLPVPDGSGTCLKSGIEKSPHQSPAERNESCIPNNGTGSPPGIRIRLGRK